MSGHSKWSTIKRAKGVADIKRGQTFTKIANAIAMAARAGGGGDLESNPRLRMILEEAKKVNMPKDNISRAIDRGLGKLPGQSLEEITFEGFGPGKVAFYIEAVTDNKMRTAQVVKNIFDRSGGNLGSLGSTAYMFEKKGELRVGSRGEDTENELLELIDSGVEDIEEFREDEGVKYLAYVAVADLHTITNRISEKGFKVEESEVVMKPIVLTMIEDQEVAKKVVEFTQKLEDLDDIQKVYANFDVAEGIVL